MFDVFVCLCAVCGAHAFACRMQISSALVSACARMFVRIRALKIALSVGRIGEFTVARFPEHSNVEVSFHRHAGGDMKI